MKYLEKTYKVPSNGLFGGVKSITLREMTTREEKILLETTNFGVFERLVKSCCVDKENQVDFNSLGQTDIMYLIFMLRELTFGADYLQKVECPHCNREQDVTVNINEMEINALADDLVEKYKDGITIELSNEDKITLKLVSIGQSNHIDKIIRQKTAGNKLKDPKGFELVLRLASSIVDISTKESDSDIDYNSEEGKLFYIESMRARDLLKLKSAFSDVSFGIDRKIYRTCEHCGEQMEVIGYVVPEFFHPSSY